MVVFKDDLDTFCKYVALRPPNIDHIVAQHLEDRHLEASIRGVYYVARYRHRPDDGEAITVTLDQYCGRADIPMPRLTTRQRRQHAGSMRWMSA